MKLISTHWHRLWLCHKFLCSIFSKGAQPFDFIKPNLIWKLTYKVQYISQINGGLIMFFQNLRIQLFGLNRYEKRNKQHSSVFKVWKWISFFLNGTDPLIIPLIFLSFYLFVKRLMITKNSVMKIQNLCESQMMTR